MSDKLYLITEAQRDLLFANHLLLKHETDLLKSLPMVDDVAMITTSARQHFIAGYLRAKQETEQIMKLAKFGADCITNAPPQIVARVAQSHGLMFTGEFDWEIEPNIEATIKELLND